MLKMYSRLAVAVACALSVGGLAACSSSNGKTVDVVEVDYKITPAVTQIAAGKVTFKVQNNGTFVHEFVVDQEPDASAIPTKADGEADEDKIPDAKHLGEVEDINPGSSKTLKLDLPAGKYVLFCNRVDGSTSHFKEGMHTDFTVTS